jgi:hypothetical protein
LRIDARGAAREMPRSAHPSHDRIHRAYAVHRETRVYILDGGTDRTCSAERIFGCADGEVLHVDRGLSHWEHHRKVNARIVEPWLLMAAVVLVLASRGSQLRGFGASNCRIDDLKNGTAGAVLRGRVPVAIAQSNSDGCVQLCGSQHFRGISACRPTCRTDTSGHRNSDEQDRCRCERDAVKWRHAKQHAFQESRE